jgi:hypothetical protein
MVEAARQEIPALATATAGLAFGSAWIDPNYSPSDQTCVTAQNRETLPGLIVLYTWVNNSDLKNEHLLWTTFPKALHEVYGFDHGHCLGNPHWDGTILGSVPNLQVRLLDSLRAATNRERIEAFITRIQGVTRSQFREVVSGIPNEWNVSAVPEFTAGQAEVQADSDTSPNCLVNAGALRINDNVRVLRNNQVVHNATISSLRHGEGETAEVMMTNQCTMSITGMVDAQIGDIVQSLSTDRFRALADYLEFSRAKVIQVVRDAFPP